MIFIFVKLTGRYRIQIDTAVWPPYADITKKIVVTDKGRGELLYQFIENTTWIY